MSPEESRIGLLEIKNYQLERKFKNSRRDFYLFMSLAFVLAPMLLRQLAVPEDFAIAQTLAIAVAAGLVGIPGFFRDRRDARNDAERRQGLYLSIHPTKNNS